MVSQSRSNASIIAILSAATSTAAAVSSFKSNANVLLAVISPPPDKPLPAVSVTPLWSMCSFATKFARASWSIATSLAPVI